MSIQFHQGYVIDIDNERYSLDLNNIAYHDPIKVFYHETDMFPDDEFDSVIEAKAMIDELISDATNAFFDALPQFRAEVKCTVTNIRDWQ